MARIVELLIALNAIGGIATYLGVRVIVQKSRRKARLIFDDAEKTPQKEVRA